MAKPPNGPAEAPSPDSGATDAAHQSLLDRLAELKASQAELAEATARSEATLSAAVDAIITIDEAGTIDGANKSALSLFGYTADELIGENVKLLMPPPYRDEHDGYLVAYRQTGTKRIIGIGREVVGLRKDNTTFPMELTVGEATTGERKLFAGVIRDITDRKQTEENLRDSLSQMSAILESAVDGIIAINEHGIIESFNRASERIFGYRAQEVLGKNVRMLMPSPYTDEHDEYLRHFLRTGQKKIIGIGREVVGLRKDGVTFPMDLSVSEAHGNSRRAFTGIVRDLSDAKNSEKALHDSLERFSALAGNAHDLISEVDKHGTIIYLSPNHEALFGFPADSEIGKNAFELVHPDDRQAQLDAVQSGGSQPLVNPPYRYRNNEGDWRWCESASTHYTTSSGESRMVSVTRDITERIEAAERLKQTEIRAHEAEKLASIATLTAGLAHDIGTPMNVVMGYADMLEKSLTEEKHIKRARLISEQAKRVTELIQTLLNISRPHEPKHARLQLADTLDHAADFYREKLKRRGITVERDFEDVPSILGDADQLEQVFLNLFVNAADAMPTGGSLRIDLSSHEPEWVQVVVRDTGTGIEPEALKRIFDPFFTTKKRGEGNGLGLLVSQGIVSEHGGTIEVESTVGEGTEFRIKLPGAPPA